MNCLMLWAATTRIWCKIVDTNFDAQEQRKFFFFQKPLHKFCRTEVQNASNEVIRMIIKTYIVTWLSVARYLRNSNLDKLANKPSLSISVSTPARLLFQHTARAARKLLSGKEALCQACPCKQQKHQSNFSQPFFLSTVLPSTTIYIPKLSANIAPINVSLSLVHLKWASSNQNQVLGPRESGQLNGRHKSWIAPCIVIIGLEFCYW